MAKRKSEFELIHWLRSERVLPCRVRLGIGDDCAAVDLGPGETCLITTDTIVDGVHFRLDEHPADLVGRKAVGVSLSDIAAMAGRALAVVSAVAIPAECPVDLAERVCTGIAEACHEFGVDLVGGDVVGTSGPLTITTTALGGVCPERMLSRSGAKAGDSIMVTGDLGGSILGRHLNFIPRLREAGSLATRFSPHAMIDVSDGVSRDLSHVLSESGGLGAELESAAIPVSAAARQLATHTERPALWHALNDGEDFELLFTAAQPEAERIVAQWGDPTLVTVIGQVTPEPGLWLRDPEGWRSPLEIEGYEHLRP